MKRTTLIAIICLFFISIVAGGTAPPKLAKQYYTEQSIVKNDVISVQVQMINLLDTCDVIKTSTDCGTVYVFYLPVTEAAKPKHYDYIFIDPCRSFKQNELVINRILASKNNIKRTLIGCSCGGAGYLCSQNLKC